MEIEFKFQIPAQRLPTLKADMLAGGASATRLRARYFDTAAGALAEHAIVLRLRQEGTRWVQTAKATLPGRGPLHRLEHNVELPEDLDGATLVADVRRHAGSKVGKLMGKVLQRHKGPLVETFATDISRLACVEQVGKSKVELALDVGKVFCGATENGIASLSAPYRESMVCELELELLEGDVADLVSLAGRWARRHGLWLSTLSKAERGERLMSGVPAQAVNAQPPDFSDVTDDALSASLVQRRVLMACLAQVLPNASEIANADTAADTADAADSSQQDPEIGHQLRVGLRRLRTALRELDGLAAQASPSAKGRHQARDFAHINLAALTDAFRVLGAHRDQHLLASDLLPKLRQAGAPEMALPSPTVGKADVPEVAMAIRAEAFQAALIALVGVASTAPEPKPVAKPEAEGPGRPASPLPVLRKRLDKLLQQIVRDGQGFDRLTPTAQHRVRKRLKRLRYLSEFTGALFGKKAAQRFVAQLAPAQDALGALNDLAVALQAYRKASATDPRAWFAVGWLSAEHAGQIQACTATLTQLAKVRPFWKKP